jgi:hypothetical protein
MTDRHRTTPSLAPSAQPLRSLRSAVAIAFALTLLATGAHAQDAKSIVVAAVHTELTADANDHTPFMYYDHDVTPDHDTLFYVVETPQGNLKKKIEDHGHPLNPQQRQADDQRIQTLLDDAAAQQRARSNSSHDDNEAEQMLRLLPNAYIWTLTNESGNIATLSFKPDPNFSPSGFEARVLSAMGGEITVHRTPGDREDRIASIKGTLLDDVTFGWGILGRLRKGGSFDVVRKEVAPGHWQMTISNVHINGHALFFKNIGSDEDESRTDFKLSPAKTLQQADEILKDIH